MYVFVITGTFHGAYVQANSEGEARHAFHSRYNGESIIRVKRLPISYFIDDEDS